MAQQVTLYLKAKSLIAGELNRAGKAIKGFAVGVGHIFAGAAKVTLGLATALTGLAVKAISAYAVQEKAVTSLASAHRMYGEDVETLVAAETALASAMQDETGVADELTISRMANLKMLGIQTSQLGNAAKATIALVKAGQGEERAMKMVADAANGNFEAFSKVIPALKNVTDESEKARMVNEYLAMQYQAQKDQLNTVGGQWAALKGRVGDAWEEVGKAIEQNGALTSVLQKAGDKVKELSARFAEWASSGGVINLISTIKIFAENFRNSFAKIGIYATGFFKGGFYDPGKAVFQYVGSVIGAFVNLTVTRFTYMKDMAIAVWEKIKNPMKDFKAPNFNVVKAAYAEMGRAIKGEYVDEIPNAFTEMHKKLEAEEVKHTGKLNKLSQEQLTNLQNINQQRVENHEEALEEIAVAEVNHAEELKKLQEEQKKDLEKLADLQKKQTDKALDDEMKALQERINKTQELIDKNKEMANAAIADIIAKKKAAEEAAKAERKEDDRGRKLAAKAAKFAGAAGGKLSKKDAEFLDAWNEKQAAKGNVQVGNFLNDMNKLALEGMQKVKDSENLQSIAGDIKTLKDKLDQTANALQVLATSVH